VVITANLAAGANACNAARAMLLYPFVVSLLHAHLTYVALFEKWQRSS
jgi:hypothetical protein